MMIGGPAIVAAADKMRRRQVWSELRLVDPVCELHSRAADGLFKHGDGRSGKKLINYFA